MGAFDIAIIVIVSVAVLAVIGTVIYRKVKHKGPSCGCGCEGCSANCSCHPNNGTQS